MGLMGLRSLPGLMSISTAMGTASGGESTEIASRNATMSSVSAMVNMLGCGRSAAAGEVRNVAER